MKKGPIILIIAGLALLVFLFSLPLTPPDEAGTAIPEKTAEGKDKNPQDSGLSPDEKVDEALAKLQSGELPPMQAILAIREVADNHPENVKANFTMGVMSVRTGQYEKAIVRFERVIEVDPDNAEAHRMMGMAYLNAGDSSLARSSYLRALELSSGEARTAIQRELDSIE